MITQLEQPRPSSVSLKPRRSLVGLIALQTLAGLIAGILGAYAGMLIGKTFFAGDPSGFGDIVASISGLIIAYPFSAAIAVWLFGTLNRLKGSLAFALIGAYLGVGVTLVLAMTLLQTQIVLGWVLMAQLGLVGALGGYYAHRAPHS